MGPQPRIPALQLPSYLQGENPLQLKLFGEKPSEIHRLRKCPAGARSAPAVVINRSAHSAGPSSRLGSPGLLFGGWGSMAPGLRF